jgi:competence protein ComEC
MKSFWIDHQRWFLWVPVGIGSGIALYFNLAFEPSWIWTLIGLLACLCLYHVMVPLFRIPFWILVGLLACEYRVHTLNTHMIQHPIDHMSIHGDIEKVEQKPHRTRIVINPHNLNYKILVSCDKMMDIAVGDHIEGTVSLKPISQSPGSYNFRQTYYFQKIGAVGSIHHIKVHHHKKNIFTIRQTITETFYKYLPDETQGIAAALVTGDRSRISKPTQMDFSKSGLAHILAISGLHFSLVAGILFFILRRGLLFATKAQYDHKKIASILVLPFLFFYLMISGVAIPAQRSFIMIGFFIVGILLDRLALSLRSLAFSAIIILCMKPESLLSASFQLSYAAVLALVSFYETGYGFWATKISSKIIRYAVGILLTTLVATLATTPFTIDIFHQFTMQSFLSNLLAIPLTGFFIMPLAIASVLSMLWGGSLWIFEWYGYALHVLKMIAHTISHWPGSGIEIHVYSIWFKILITMGGVWLCLWKSKMRWLGIIPILIAPFFMGKAPDIVVSYDGKIIGANHDGVLYMSKFDRFHGSVWKDLIHVKNIKKWKYPIVMNNQKIRHKRSQLWMGKKLIMDTHNPNHIHYVWLNDGKMKLEYYPNRPFS